MIGDGDGDGFYKMLLMMETNAESGKMQAEGRAKENGCRPSGTPHGPDGPGADRETLPKAPN